MWTSNASWHDKEPYSCCPDGYTLVGEHGTEATLTAEWWSRYFNVLVHPSLMVAPYGARGGAWPRDLAPSPTALRELHGPPGV